MALQTVKLQWTGLRPLIMSNVRAVDPLDPQVKRLKQLFARRGKDKTEAILAEIAHLEWEISLYYDVEIGLHIPSEMIHACLKEGGTKTKIGKAIVVSAWLPEPLVPFKVQPKFKDLDTLYGNDNYRFRLATRTPPKTGARVMKTR